MSANGNGGATEEHDESLAVLQHAVIEIIAKLERVEMRQEVIDHKIQESVNNTLRLLQFRDPLAWWKRAAVLGVASLVGSALAAGVVHTVALAYFR